MKKWRLKRVYRIPLIYGVFSVLWIFFSDRIAFAFAPDIAHAVLYSTVKGTAFVIISTFLIYLHLKFDERKQHSLLTEMVEVQHSFNLLFENNPQPMWIYDDKTLEVLAVNPAACLKYGYTTDEFLKLKITELRSPEDIPQLMQVLKGKTGILRQTGPWQHVKKGGEPLFVEVISHPLKLAGMDSTLVSIIDLTEHQKTLTELSTAIQERNDFESFSFTASHDLKAPLRGVIGYSELLLKEYDGKLDEEGTEFLRQIHLAGISMNEMLDDLLALAGITHQPIQLEDINLGDIASDVVKTLKSHDPDRQVSVVIQPEVMVCADRGALKIAIQNLLQNAWKYTSGNSAAKIEIGSFTNDRQEKVIYVKDNGVGFDQSYANKVFEPFVRAQPDTMYEGLGIGLSIVRRAVERHGGRIWVEAESGQGATFFFTLQESA